jgi:hypothetical protein
MDAMGKIWNEFHACTPFVNSYVRATLGKKLRSVYDIPIPSPEPDSFRFVLEKLEAKIKEPRNPT